MNDWISLATAFLSALAAVLAWAAKLWWGKEQAAAKEELIKAKDAHIALLEREVKSLQGFTPMKIREYFLIVKSQLEEYTEQLTNENTNLKHKSLEEREQHLAELGQKQEEIKILLGKIESFNRQIEGMREYMSGNYYQS